MSFAEQPASKQWSALKYNGDNIAEVWFKPEGEPFGLSVRIPRTSFEIPGLREHLTVENLLKALGLAREEVETWSHEGASTADRDGSAFDLPLPPSPPPSPDVDHLTLHVRLKRPPEAAAPHEGGGPEVSEAKWQDLEGLWNGILGLEANIDTVRIRMESLLAEMEAAWQWSLTPEEKFHALNADVSQWTKAKNRVHHSLPKMREFIHRAVWAAGTPERKKLAELIKNYIEPRVPFPELDELADQLESLRKERQVLSAHGVTVYQDCKTIAMEVQGALRTLQANAKARRTKQRGAAKGKRKFS